MVEVSTPDIFLPLASQAMKSSEPIKREESTSVSENLLPQQPLIDSADKQQQQEINNMLQQAGLTPPENQNEPPSTATETKPRQSLLTGLREWIINLFHQITRILFPWKTA